MASSGLTRQVCALWRPWSDLRRTVADMSHLLAPSRARGVLTSEPGGSGFWSRWLGIKARQPHRQGTDMKKILGSIAVLALAMPVGAQAADLPVAPAYKAPVMAPVLLAS